MNVIQRRSFSTFSLSLSCSLALLHPLFGRQTTPSFTTWHALSHSFSLPLSLPLSLPILLTFNSFSHFLSLPSSPSQAHFAQRHSHALCEIFSYIFHFFVRSHSILHPAVTHALSKSQSFSFALFDLTYSSLSLPLALALSCALLLPVCVSLLGGTLQTTRRGTCATRTPPHPPWWDRAKWRRSYALRVTRHASRVQRCTLDVTRYTLHVTRSTWLYCARLCVFI